MSLKLFNLFFFLLSVYGIGAQELRPVLFAELPDFCNTPDALAITPDQRILVSVPNFNDTSYPGFIIQTDIEGNIEPFYPALLHEETGRGAPMGMEFGPDGHLYYADNQYFFDKNYKSRIIRVILKKGKPFKSEVVVEGFKLANAVRWSGDHLYVSDTFFDLGNPEIEGYSGIYRIPLSEMNVGPVQLIRDKSVDDPHLLVKAKTIPFKNGTNAGLDGICFDRLGNLYTGSFGDGKFYRATFDSPNGAIKTFEVIDTSLQCIDGISYDSSGDRIFIADSKNNAIFIWDVKNGKMQKLWENDDSDGSDGLLDQPCEAIFMDGKLVISNFDMPFPLLKNKVYDRYHTLSAIDLN